MIFFTTINCDGESKSFCWESRRLLVDDWHSDNFTGPGNDDPLLCAATDTSNFMPWILEKIYRSGQDRLPIFNDFMELMERLGE